MADSLQRTITRAAALGLFLVACGGPATTSDAAGDGPEAGVKVLPAQARLVPGQALDFEAAGVSTTVTWSVQEGSAGGQVDAVGVYTAPALNGTFHVVAVSSADPTKSGVATVVVAGQPPPVNGAPMTTANRSAGVAPLSVFFDAVDSVPQGAAAPFSWVSGVYQPTDGDYEGVSYLWDFGDGGAGVWSTTGVSRNTATGFTAAHVFETPGSYTVSLTVIDKAGAVSTYKQTITVAAFSGTTYYVSSAGNDANDGRSEATPFRTAAKGLSLVNAPNRRILFRRGDTFATTSTYISSAGPGIIGAYGTGNRPVLASNTTDATVFTIRGADWRIMDLDLPGTGVGASAVGFDVSYQTVNALLLRLSAPNWRVGLGWGDWTPILATPHDGAAMVECEVAASEVNGVYVGGRRIAIMGNDIHDMATSHVLRVWQAHKGVISNNRLWNPGATRHALKLHGGAVGDGRPETRFVTVSDNLIRGKTWSVAIGPQDSGSDERVSHVVFERNQFFGEASVQVDLEIWARQVLVRNNVFDATGVSNYYAAISAVRRGVEPAPQDVRVFNNTVVRGDSGAEFTVLQVASDSANVTVRNNLASAPLASTRTMVAGSRGPGFAEDHNLLSSTPGFTDVAGGDYSLLAGSPAVDAGVALSEVRTDHLGNARPRGAGYDLGALESR